jgi:hypothetical protein
VSSYTILNGPTVVKSNLTVAQDINVVGYTTTFKTALSQLTNTVSTPVAATSLLYGYTTIPGGTYLLINCAANTFPTNNTVLIKFKLPTISGAGSISGSFIGFYSNTSWNFLMALSFSIGKLCFKWANQTPVIINNSPLNDTAQWHEIILNFYAELNDVRTLKITSTVDGVSQIYSFIISSDNPSVPDGMAAIKAIYIGGGYGNRSIVVLSGSPDGIYQTQYTSTLLPVAISAFAIYSSSLFDNSYINTYNIRTPTISSPYNTANLYLTYNITKGLADYSSACINFSTTSSPQPLTYSSIYTYQ